jgi:hypothetical protein
MPAEACFNKSGMLSVARQVAEQPVLLARTDFSQSDVQPLSVTQVTGHVAAFQHIENPYYLSLLPPRAVLRTELPPGGHIYLSVLLCLSAFLMLSSC